MEISSNGFTTRNTTSLTYYISHCTLYSTRYPASIYMTCVSCLKILLGTSFSLECTLELIAWKLDIDNWYQKHVKDTQKGSVHPGFRAPQNAHHNPSPWDQIPHFAVVLGSPTRTSPSCNQYLVPTTLNICVLYRNQSISEHTRCWIQELCFNDCCPVQKS